jgi:hypothetical protein
MKDALEMATEFFNLPNDEKKMLFFSDNGHKPVRYEQVLIKPKMKYFAGEISSNTTLIQYQIGFICGLQILPLIGLS